MRRFIMIAVVAASVSTSITVAAQQLTGTWSGAMGGPAFWGGVEIESTPLQTSARIQMLGRISAAPVREIVITGNTLTFTTEWEGRSLHFQGRFDGMRLSGTVVYQPGDGPSVSGEWRALKLDGSALHGLPGPTGPYGVSRRTFYWTDTNREELSTTAPGDKRQVVAHVWYPVLGRRSMEVPYLPDAERMAGQLPRDSRDAVVSLTLNVADGPLPDSGRLPVVIFSPGAGVKALLYTSLQQELASHGFIVAALEHPYDAPVVVLPGGTEIRPLPRDQRPTSNLSGIDAMRQSAEYRAQDILSVKRLLGRKDSTPASFFRDKLDMSSVVVVGHSLGGVAAYAACNLDRTLRACVNIDGAYRARPYAAAVEDLSVQQPLLWLRRPLYVFTDQQLKNVGMTREDFNTEIAIGREMMARARGGAFDVQFPHVGIDHMDFSDLRLFDANANESVLRARLLTMQMTRAWVVEFLQKSLQGRLADLLITTSAEYREARVSRFN